jgi:hypothetical protein
MDAASSVDAAMLERAAMQADADMRVAALSHAVERSAVAVDFMVAAEAASTVEAVMVGAVDMVAADTGKLVRSLI